MWNHVDVLRRMHNVLGHTREPDRLVHGVEAMTRYRQALFVF
ncbi:hypothetical protein ATPR_3481 [Acetobacter tropicalis NBRC 101654]|uniref:Uncharacterized protein n=1 Tax=Acetobacter tropicalis NBRC 101654 TaxID=749388 RepID=F7VJD2_9PROT|nr:hypothetical protein ATPR_3481 [Acetobacter tropicalis NBRC 101654]